MRAKANEGKRTRTLARNDRRAVRKAEIPDTTVTVTFRHMDSNDALRNYAVRKFSHLARFLNRACKAHLILSVDKYRQRGEVIVKSGRLAVAAQDQSRDFYAVIDLLADKVGRQLKSHLGKVKAKKVRAPSTGQVLSAVEQTPPDSGPDRT
jgi:putative sigma-54 modulation protein